MEPRKKVQVWIHGFDPAGHWRVLILRMTPVRGGGWQPVTGSVEPGESLAAAALREAQEETGLPFAAPVVPLDRLFEFESRGERVEEHGFSLEAPNGIDAVRIDPHEHVEYRWVPPDEALRLLRFPENGEMLKVLRVRQSKR